MNGQRLELARKRAGLSLRGLSEEMGGEPSHQAIRKYERGEMTPSSSILVRLARTLNVSIDFLMSDEVRSLEGVEFRKLSTSSAKDRARVEADVMEHVDRYLSVEEILGLNSAHWEPPFAMRRLTSESEVEELADSVREAWDLGHDPIPNLTELLEEQGLKVFVVPLPAKVSGLTCWVSRDRGEPLPVIVVNRDHGLERRRFTLAHELAHRLIDPASPVKVEQAANRFAGAFLVAANHLRERASTGGSPRKLVSPAEIVRLKRLYRVSAAALLMRLGQAGVLTESAVRYAFQTFGRGWRRNEPNPLESDGKPIRELPKRFEQLCYWALAERLIVPGRAAELLGVSMSQIEEALKGPSDVYADHRQ